MKIEDTPQYKLGSLISEIIESAKQGMDKKQEILEKWIASGFAYDPEIIRMMFFTMTNMTRTLVEMEKDIAVLEKKLELLKGKSVLN